jgi:hydroxyacylglutathione hydrolase
LVIDLRPAADYRKAYLQGSINIPATSNSFTTYVGWFVDYSRPLYLIMPDVAELEEILGKVRAIGVDQVAGYGGADVVDANSEPMPVINAHELATRLPQNGMMIVDVRGQSEYRERHIAGAANIPLGSLPQHLDQLPQFKTIVVQCASGYRSQIAASLLRAKGFENVLNLQADIAEWSQALETVSSDEPGK